MDMRQLQESERDVRGTSVAHRYLKLQNKKNIGERDEKKTFLRFQVDTVVHGQYLMDMITETCIENVHVYK